MDEWTYLAAAAHASWQRAGCPRRILAAVSGGADSVALLMILHEMMEEGRIVLSAAYVDHGLRAESGADGEHVASLCQRLGVPFSLLPVKLQGASEDEAREARYEALLHAAAFQKAEALALAHHQKDQAETVLLHLFRGSGGSGLGGMAEAAPRILPNGSKLLFWRPFLSVPPEKLRSCLEQKGIPWREDATNHQDHYLRNYLRHQVLPVIEARLPKAEEAMSRAADICKQEADYFEKEARSFLLKHACLLGPCRWIEGPALAGLHPAMKRHVVRLSCPVSLDFETTAALSSLPPGKILNLPSGWRAQATARFLHFLPPKEEKPVMGRLWQLPFLGSKGDGIWEQAFPKALLSQCSLRFWQPGDTICPLGAPGHKSLQDYFVDRKIDRPFRPYLPLLCKGHQVIWVIGSGPGEEARISPGMEAAFLRYEGPLPGRLSPAFTAPADSAVLFNK